MSINNQPSPTDLHTAEDLLTYIQEHLPDLWRIQHSGGNRFLRTVLNTAQQLKDHESSVESTAKRWANNSTRRR
jgi:hypothetical protein